MPEGSTQAWERSVIRVKTTAAFIFPPLRSEFYADEDRVP